MDLEALYKQVGGSAGEVLKRIPSEKMLRKFVGKIWLTPPSAIWNLLRRFRTGRVLSWRPIP